MHPYFLLFLVLSVLLVANSVRAFYRASGSESRVNHIVNGVLSLLAAAAIAYAAHFMFNFL